MFRFLAFAAALALPGAAFAQDGGASDQDGPPERVRSVILYGDEKCPESTEEEIVVCAREEDSPYRIPSDLRESVERPARTSWAVRVEDMMDANRVGLPDSCSPVGSGGQTGCTMEMLKKWQAMQRMKRREEAVIPGGE